MTEWKVPGLAIAVVHNGETVLLKAYGQRDVEAGLPVRRGPDGKIHELVFHQPNGTYIAKPDT